MKKDQLDKIIRSLSRNKHVLGATFQLSLNNEIHNFSFGNLNEKSRFYIASINKLVTAALILRLVREEKLHHDDLLCNLLPEKYWKGLHTWKGTDYSKSISLKHLLSQSSGLPCYLEDKMPDGSRAMDLFLKGNDQSWPMERVIQAAKLIKAKFPPGTKGKAHYGELNYRLLDEVLFAKTGKQIDELGEALFQELGMLQTAFLHKTAAQEYVPIISKNGILKIEKYAESTRHEIISTSGDLMLFIKAYFEGAFYPKEKLASLQIWNRIFFPFKYGIGIQQFSIPRFFSPFKKIPTLIGHCGSVGSVAFFIPEKNVYATGTVNLAGQPQLVFQTLIKMLNKI
jgi:D-alanyl-D-alanine carboxypeptidase